MTARSWRSSLPRSSSRRPARNRPTTARPDACCPADRPALGRRRQGRCSRPGGDFTLTGPGGKPYALADARGSAVVLFFGYASCPDFCPRAMGLVKSAVAKLDPAQAARVRPIFVSVDPDRDTPASLERYLQHLVGTAGGRAGADWRHRHARPAARGDPPATAATTSGIRRRRAPATPSRIPRRST